ncbi:MAG: universal stress protein UspA [Nocardioides sp.]|jgi:nucleotide-binding universal stress UspA family protein|uniref:universal stress protein n=1 Tax=Nocardioides sp. TaxID=35761 RepID=UPI002628089F|nr:universal stress protein [Nocardioides sp.]MCW2833774.1 universal stress protein UspA [Nocardioides sp.]
MSIVIAYSPDIYGRAALEHALAEARLRETSLVVVNVTRGDSLVDSHYAHEDEVQLVMDRLKAEGVDATVRRDVVPDIADAVLDVAAEEHATLIVVGVRHRSAVGKMLLGSVAQRVILDASCPVLAVKPS